MWGKKSRTESLNDVPAPVTAGDEHGNDITVGNHNSPGRKVIIRQSYSGIPNKDFRFRVDDSMVSAVYAEGKGYLSDYVTGNVRPSDYWEKKLLRTVKTEISVLSFSDMVFSIASPITFRASGGDVDATVFGDFRFIRGNPRNISSILQGTYTEKENNGAVEIQYVTAEGLEQIIRAGLQDIVCRPLFRDRVYSDLEELSEIILEQMKSTPFFSERCIECTQLDVRPNRTEFEKLDDAEALHKIELRKIELDSEIAAKKKQAVYNSQIAEQEQAVRIEESKKRLAELESEINDCKRTDSMKDAEAELQKIKLSLDAEHYETDYQDGRKKRELDDQQQREIELLKAKTDSLIMMAQAATCKRESFDNCKNDLVVCQNCGKEVTSGSRTCPECGFTIPIIKHSNKDIPEEIAIMFDRIKGAFSGIEKDVSQDEAATVMSPVVRNLPHNFKGTVVATDSITFEPSREYVLQFCHNEEAVVSVHFYEEVAFRREIDANKQRLMFYSDYANYSVNDDVVGAGMMRTVTRQPILIICLEDRFYLYCTKETGYLKIDGVEVGQDEITELDIGKRVALGNYISFFIESA